MKKILTIILGVVVLLVVILGVLVLVTPGDFAVEREIVISKPKAEVFAYLKLVKNQNVWSPWVKKDPKIKQTFEGTDGTEGFVYKWESDHPDVGSGEQEIKKITDGDRIDVELRFKKPFESVSPAYFVTEAVGDDKTKVRWGFSGSIPKPWNIMNIFWDIDAAAGKEFEAGLADLKIEMEKQVAAEPPSSEGDSDAEKGAKSESETKTADDAKK